MTKSIKNSYESMHNQKSRTVNETKKHTYKLRNCKIAKIRIWLMI